MHNDHNAEDHIHTDITTCNIEKTQQKYRLEWSVIGYCEGGGGGAGAGSGAGGGGGGLKLVLLYPNPRL